MFEVTNAELFRAIRNPLRKLCPEPWEICNAEAFPLQFIKNGERNFVVTIEDGIDAKALIARVQNENDRGEDITNAQLNLLLKMLVMEMRIAGLMLDADNWIFGEGCVKTSSRMSSKPPSGDVVIAETTSIDVWFELKKRLPPIVAQFVINARKEK